MPPTSAEDPRRRPPTGWRRFIARLPVQLYRAGLGRLFGERMLLLTHTGRISGQARQVVVEVVAQYAPQHPRAARALCRYLGLPSDGTPEGYRAAGRKIPFVRLVAFPEA